MDFVGEPDFKLFGFKGEVDDLCTALALYVLGSIGLVLWRGKSKGEWKEMHLGGGCVSCVRI